MAYPPTQISVAYSGGPTVLTIPTGSNATDFVRAIVHAGGFWTVPNPAANTPSSQTWIPYSEVTSITAS